MQLNYDKRLSFTPQVGDDLALKYLAQRDGVTVSALIRDAVTSLLVAKGLRQAPADEAAS